MACLLSLCVIVVLFPQFNLCETTFKRENDPLYQKNFDQGYFPFDDFEETPNETKGMLENRDYCNRVFAEYLDAEKLSIKYAPPDYPMKIAILFVVTNLYEVNEKDQTVTLTTFIELSWKDKRLADIGGNKCANITKIIPNLLPIFFPVFTIENSADRVLYEEAWEKFPAVIYSPGVVVWITSLRLVLNCRMNMRIFPYDSQNCFVLIRSPHYYLSELQYYVYSRDTALLLWNENVSHPLWQLTGQMARLMSSNISGIEIWFKLERKPSFYIWTLIIPTGIISMASCLTFTLPHDSGEKMQTMLTGILSYFLLLLTMTEVTPQASENIPVLTLFFVVVIGVGMIGAIACAILIRLNSRSQRKMGTSSNQIVRFLNDAFLLTYSGTLAACYVGLFVYIDLARREIDETVHSEFNYTDVQNLN